MKFRFIYTDTFDGCVKGTNSEHDAVALAECEELFVADVQTFEWLHADGTRHPITEAE